MKPSEYINNVLKTEARDMTPVIKRVGELETIRLLHAATGLCTETGEIQDNLKRHIFYGKEIDRNNLIEESGDLLWYIAIMLHTLDSSFEEAMEKNITKLRKRYGEKFSEAAALNRDIAKEQEVFNETRSRQE